MKKILTFIVAMLTVLAFTLPSQAEKVTETLSIGIDLKVDTFYYKQDKEGFANTGRSAGLRPGATTLEEDRAQTFVAMNRTGTLYFIWNVKDKAGATVVTSVNGEDYKLQIPFAYGFWNIVPDLRLQAGKGTTIFSDLEPDLTMGANSMDATYGNGVQKMYGIGYGNYFSGYNAYARLEYRLGNFGKLQAGICDPRGTTAAFAASATGLGLANNGAAIDNVTVIPRFEAGIPVNFGLVSLYPSAFWQLQKFDNVKAGWDDKVTSYGLSLGVKSNFKPVIFRAEINYGQNWGNTEDMNTPMKSPDYTTFGAQVSSAKADATGSIQNSTGLGAWVQAGANIGMFAPSIVVGYQKYNREINGLTDELTTMMYGFTCPITVAKGVTIRPEVMVYDNGNSNKIAGVEYKFGKELLAGLQFEFIF